MRKVFRALYRHEAQYVCDILAQEGIEAIVADTKSALSRVASDEEQKLVDTCLEEIGAEHREVLLLRDYAGASWEEVGSELGRPTIGACQQLYQRARRALGERIVLKGLGSTQD